MTQSGTPEPRQATPKRGNRWWDFVLGRQQASKPKSPLHVQSGPRESQNSSGFDGALSVVREHFGDSRAVVQATEVCVSAIAGLLIAEADGCLAVVLEEVCLILIG